MSNEISPLSHRRVRSTDSNSLLRLHDIARDILAKSLSQVERIRASKAIDRLGKELQRRKVRF